MPTIVLNLLICALNMYFAFIFMSITVLCVCYSIIPYVSSICISCIPKFLGNTQIGCLGDNHFWVSVAKLMQICGI